MRVLSDDQVQDFIRDGFVRLEGAFPAGLAAECRDILWGEIGLSPDQPEKWLEPMCVVHERNDEPFLRAASTPRLYAAFDELVGTGRWRPLDVLGYFLIRFPGGVEPPDNGWHVDGAYPTDDEEASGINVRSRGLGLLLLFLFSDVTIQDAPTMLRIGSHLHVPRLLEPFGEAGTTDRDLFKLLEVTSDYPVGYATGNAGDVYLCHPFLVHTAQAHHGSNPRFLAQPGLGMIGAANMDPAAVGLSPVEVAVRRGLDLSGLPGGGRRLGELRPGELRELRQVVRVPPQGFRYALLDRDLRCVADVLAAVADVAERHRVLRLAQPHLDGQDVSVAREALDLLQDVPGQPDDLGLTLGAEIHDVLIQPGLLGREGG
jgi:hypothetical protein